MNMLKYMIISALFVQGALVGASYFPEWGKDVPKDEMPGIYYGPTSIDNQNVENLTIYGPATIVNSKVTQSAIVKGPLEARGTSFNTLDVDGIVNLDDSKVNKDLSLNGPLYARKSTIENATIRSDLVALSDSKITKLVIKKSGRMTNGPRVFLEKGSKIDSLTFETNDGRVIYADDTVKVTNLEGGKIESKK